GDIAFDFFSDSFIGATVRLARYAFSRRYRSEIDGRYRTRNPLWKWWYLGRGSVPLLVASGVLALLLWPKAPPVESAGHHPIRAVEQSIADRLHKAHEQD